MKQDNRFFCLCPPEGWERFEASNAATDLLWRRLQGWDYMNFTSCTSIWADREGSGSMLYVAYSGEKMVELTVELPSDSSPAADTLRALLSELESTFALRAEGASP